MKVLLYMGYISMCHPKSYGSQPSWSWIGHRFWPFWSYLGYGFCTLLFFWIYFFIFIDKFINNIVLLCTRGGLMGCTLDSGASGLGLNPGRGHCVVFLGKTLNSHSSSYLHPGIWKGTGEFLGKLNKLWGNRPFRNSAGNWGEFQILTNR